MKRKSIRLFGLVGLFLLTLLASRGRASGTPSGTLVTSIEWKILAPLDDKIKYHIQMTYLQVKEEGYVSHVLEYVNKVADALPTTPGAMRYSLFLKPDTRQFWTLTVWTDTESMDKFVASKVHQDAISAFDQSEVGGFDFLGWDRFEKDMPYDWRELVPSFPVMPVS